LPGVPVIYDLDTIERVKAARSQLAVSETQLIVGGDVVTESAHQRLADELIRYCRPLGVEIHPADIIFQRKSAESFNEGMVMFRARWQPLGRPVEFHGGPQGGTVMAVPDYRPQDVLEFPVLPAMYGPMWHADAPLEPVVPGRIAYRYAGWNERTRQWVYRLSP
jgi:hypothetical protein